MTTIDTIRKQFFDFFESKKHQIIPSASILIKNDPSLLFTNAGMNPFKSYFLGNATPEQKRVANTQKCLRVSGKHNDLEEVGIDTYHHTFFEMLGNWSFGDYFKQEAINWAWELLTKVYNIPPENLYITIFGGAPSENFKKDEEAYKIWSKIVPKNKILMGSKKDNFWEMGEQGPCGPCSEIHIDIRNDNEKRKVSGADLVNKDHPEVIEIWNLVFMEFNRKAGGSLEKLPSKHIDTGMGLERLAMVLQGVKSNYDIDIFSDLIKNIEILTKTIYGKEKEKDIAIRVIADHIRAVYFTIADGQLPSNNGAGYVIRRILRRAIRYAYTFLNKKEPFIFQLVAVLSKQMGKTFPELIQQQQLAQNVIREEENSFLKTLEQGLKLLEMIINNSNNKKINGQKAFELYDTYGFPIDLTILIAKERGFTIDEEKFNIEMQKQKNRSRLAAENTIEDWIVLPKNNEEKKEKFVGYDLLATQIKIAQYRKITLPKEGEIYQLVFNLTPFYPESGGQIGDKGYLKDINGKITYIIDTKKENDLIIHFAKSLPNNIASFFDAIVDSERRQRTSRNHTATHLLHQALRNILGKHVEQKGSMIRPREFRFDFSHFAKLKEEEIKNVEQFVNDRIREQIQLKENRNVPIKKALQKGAIALFGEKYDDTVRTITFGKSTELCGGTHVKNTTEIWLFKIKNETAVASGIRRIEAITSDDALKYFETQTQHFEKVRKIIHNDDPIKTIQNLQKQNDQLKKQIESLQKEKINTLKETLKKEIQKIHNVDFFAKQIDIKAQQIKSIALHLAKEYPNLFFVAASKENKNKAILHCYIAENLIQKGYNAVNIINTIAKKIDGKGGGQVFFASAGGKNPNGINEAIQTAKKLIHPQ